MRKAVIAAAVAILLLTAGALWFISDATRDDRPRLRPEGHAEARPGPPDRPGAAGAAGERAGQGDPAGAAGPSGGPGAGTAPAAPVGPQPVPLLPWKQVRTARLNAIRGPERDAVIFGMQNLKDDLNGCFHAENQPTDGARVEAAPGAWDEAEEGRTVLLLSLEAHPGEVVVEDVAVQVRGGAPDALVSCFQRLLQGRAFTSLEARPGWRQKVRLPVAKQR